jgi:restriction endonuclease S subunit
MYRSGSVRYIKLRESRVHGASNALSKPTPVTYSANYYSSVIRSITKAVIKFLCLFIHSVHNNNLLPLVLHISSPPVLMIHIIR